MFPLIFKSNMLTFNDSSAAKAFLCAMGLHGLLTPSSLQLLLRRELLLGRSQKQRQQWKPPTVSNAAVKKPFVAR